jgi:hypothetical protein
MVTLVWFLTRNSINMEFFVLGMVSLVWLVRMVVSGVKIYRQGITKHPFIQAIAIILRIVINTLDTAAWILYVIHPAGWLLVIAIVADLLITSELFALDKLFAEFVKGAQSELL